MKSQLKQALFLFIPLVLALHPHTNFGMNAPAPLNSQLRYAIHKADLLKVEELLKLGVNPNGTDFCKDPVNNESFLIDALDYHWTYLNSENHHSHIEKSLKIMKALIDAGADPHFKSRYGSALEKAQERNYPQSVISLLMGTEHDRQVPDNFIPTYKQQWWIDARLKEACNNRDLEAAREWLSKGANPNRRVPGFDQPETEETLLIYCLQKFKYFRAHNNGWLDIVKELVEHGADSAGLNSSFENALDIARKEGFSQEVITLLAKQEKG